MRLFYTTAFLLCILYLYPQKYNFVNWTVEDGLLQSQASFISQDRYRQLWIGTEGGLSCFDGKKFKGYTVQEGLPANHISSLLSTGDRLYIGTNNGLCAFNGRNFQAFKIDTIPADNIRSVLEADGQLYVLCNFKLFSLQPDGTSQRVIVSGDSSEKISAICLTPDNKLIACVYGEGIFAGDKKNWKKVGMADSGQLRRVIIRCYVSSGGDSLFAYSNGLFSLRNGRIVRYSVNGNESPTQIVLCIEQDEKGNYWLGTDKGACKIEGDRFIAFNGHSGFTDNTVNWIFRDAENNLWFATNADGIYKYRENTFTYYDRSSGLQNPVVMGITQTPDNTIYVAGYGGWLLTTSNGSALRPASKSAELLDSKINCLYTASDGQVWIGTLTNGIFTYNKKNGLGRPHVKVPEMLPPGATVFSEDQEGNVIIGGAHGIYVIGKDKRGVYAEEHLPFITALKRTADGKTIVGTARGLYILESGVHVKPWAEEHFSNAAVMCLDIQGDQLFVGTSDKGIYAYNLKTNKLRNYNTADGLPNNFIYSIDAAEKGKIWAGTGFGISRIGLSSGGDILSIKNYGRSDGLLGMECNHNSLLRANDSSLWFGTTKGLFHFDPRASTPEKARPLVILKSVKLFSSDIRDESLYMWAGNWFPVPEGLNLAYNQNHLSFELGSLYFTNPEDVLYKYQLEGADKGYTTSNNPFIMYPSLPPGNYKLKVKAVTKGGMESENEISYSFTIRKAFYQTSYFQFMVIVILVSAGALLAWLITRARHRRRQKEKALHERIREEEFIKLRQRTAEDFHDEMGNNLTRIAVLTDMLKLKLNGHGQEVARILEQIRENTGKLYKGSRDIIWSLNSKNDALFEIAEHMRQIGNELFQDTAVDFRYAHNIKPENPLRLKLDYSRNLTMIFKEAYNNILKHANASKVEVEIELQNNKVLQVKLRDNGSGFECSDVSKGNGLKNMRTRVSRMQGALEVKSERSSGTEIDIKLDNIFVN